MGTMDGKSEALARAVGPASTPGRQRVAAVGGLLGALAASSCCIMPLVLFSLGAGGVWIGGLTVLAPWQPVFVVLALGFLGYGYWHVYRKSKVCGEGDACPRRVPNRLVTASLWTATGLVAAALAFPYVAPVLLGI